MRFDSGRTITLDDVTHHLLALGTTGSGKSWSVIFPVLYRLFQAGAFGIIIDIKGNLRRIVRALASVLGREADIIEFGTSGSARPLNLLNGMGRHQMRGFLEHITKQHFNGQTHNMDWHMKGVASAADCGQLLLFLNEKHQEIQPDCRLISEMVNEPAEARKLYDYFRKKIYDEKRLDHRRFVSSIENYRFHALKEVKNTTSSSGTTLDEQLSWGLQGVRDGLRNFLGAPGVEKNFCCAGAPGLDLSEPITQGKIIVLRFELDTGPAGASLSRMLLSHFYSCIFGMGLLLQKGRKSFVCVDEFQEVADLSSERLSDSSFIALAREFNCCFIAATQSMTALMARGTEPAAVTSFVSNCNQKILLHSDDPVTQELVAPYDPELRLCELGSGEAFAVTYNQRERKHEFGRETLHDAYGLVKKAIENVEPEVPALPDNKSGEENTLIKLAEWVEHELGLTSREEEPEEKLEGKKGRKNRWDGTEGDRSQEDEIRRLREMEARHKKIRERQIMKGNCGELIRNFPEMFEGDMKDATFSIPKGWEDYFERVFKAFRATGLPVKIKNIRLIDGMPRATDSGGYWGDKNLDGLELLNRLLAGAADLCIICENHVLDNEMTPNRRDDKDSHDASLLICQDCLKNFGLDTWLAKFERRLLARRCEI